MMRDQEDKTGHGGKCVTGAKGGETSGNVSPNTHTAGRRQRWVQPMAWCIGDAVQAAGLSRAELNGRVGRVLGYDEPRGRHIVEINGSKVLIKPANLGRPDALDMISTHRRVRRARPWHERSQAHGHGHV